MRWIYSLLLVSLFIGPNLFAEVGSSSDSITAFTTSGEEVVLKKNNTWSYKKNDKTTGTKIKVGVTSIRQVGEYCEIKFEVQNQTPLNFKAFWPDTNLVDKRKNRFSTSNIQIAIRPNQTSLTEVNYYNATCSEIANIEIDSFKSCSLYPESGKGSAGEAGSENCIKLLQPLVGTKIPVVVISQK